MDSLEISIFSSLQNVAQFWAWVELKPGNGLITCMQCKQIAWEKGNIETPWQTMLVMTTSNWIFQHTSLLAAHFHRRPYIIHFHQTGKQREALVLRNLYTAKYKCVEQPFLPKWDLFVIMRAHNLLRGVLDCACLWCRLHKRRWNVPSPAASCQNRQRFCDVEATRSPKGSMYGLTWSVHVAKPSLVH